MTDVHYDLRASERGAAKSRLKDIISIGAPVEKRKAFWKKREKDVKCFLFYGQVHILSADLKKRINKYKSEISDKDHERLNRFFEKDLKSGWMNR